MTKPRPTRSKTGNKSVMRPQVTKVILHLTLVRSFFDQILSGSKKTEFREDKPYWRTRLFDRTYTEVHFRNGYAATAPFMRVECLGIRKPSNSDHRFKIRLGRILSYKFCKKP